MNTLPTFGDRVQETFATTGTGTISLGGAVTGYQAFSSVVANAGTCYYAATDGTNWEVGLGTYTTSGDTLARTTILASSNSGSAVSWSAGTKNIWLDIPASYLTAGVSGASMVLLGSATASNSASVSLTIPTGYDHLILEIEGLVPATGSTSVQLQFNSDTGSNYGWEGFWIPNSGSSNQSGSGGSNNYLLLNAGSTLGAAPFSGNAHIMFAQSSTGFKVVTGHFAYNNGSVDGFNVCAGRYFGTAVLSSLQLSMNSGNLASGTFRLYGIRNA
jgi:hypothetical protein